VAGCGHAGSRPAAEPPTANPAPVRAATGRGLTPPALVETGRDFVAIARSIDDYHGWLLAHRPDPAAADTIYEPGTRSYLDFTRHLAALRARHQTLVSIGQRCTYAVASVRPALVTLRVHEALREDRVLDTRGRVVAVTPYPRPNDYVVVLARGAGARWRLADITEVST
jgi:hypothetical protein